MFQTIAFSFLLCSSHGRFAAVIDPAWGTSGDDSCGTACVESARSTLWDDSDFFNRVESARRRRELCADDSRACRACATAVAARFAPAIARQTRFPVESASSLSPAVSDRSARWIVLCSVSDPDSDDTFECFRSVARQIDVAH